MYIITCALLILRAKLRLIHPSQVECRARFTENEIAKNEPNVHADTQDDDTDVDNEDKNNEKKLIALTNTKDEKCTPFRTHLETSIYAPIIKATASTATKTVQGLLNEIRNETEKYFSSNKNGMSTMH